MLCPDLVQTGRSGGHELDLVKGSWVSSAFGNEPEQTFRVSLAKTDSSLLLFGPNNKQSIRLFTLIYWRWVVSTLPSIGLSHVRKSSETALFANNSVDTFPSPFSEECPSDNGRLTLCSSLEVLQQHPLCFHRCQINGQLMSVISPWDIPSYTQHDRNALS